MAKKGKQGDIRTGWLADLKPDDKVIVVTPVMGDPGQDKLQLATVKEVLPSGCIRIHPRIGIGTFTPDGVMTGSSVYGPRLAPCTPEDEARAARQAKEVDVQRLLAHVDRNLHFATDAEIEALWHAAQAVYMARCRVRP